MAKVEMPDSFDNSDKKRLEELEGDTGSTDTKKQQIGSMRKKNLAMKFADLFFEGDLKSAVSYMIYDVAIPQARNALLEGFKVLIFGGVRKEDDRSDLWSQTSYTSFWKNQAKAMNNAKQNTQNVAMKRFNPRSWTSPDRATAEQVLLRVKFIMKDQGHVCVSQFFSEVGIISDWTTEDYGWTGSDLDNVRVCQCREGWFIDFPKPYPIN